MAEDQVRDISLAVRELLQSGREMQAAAARELGVNTTDVQAMDLVTAHGGDLSPRDLAGRLGIRTASASALIDRLERAGHLERADVTGPKRFQGVRTRLVATEHARMEIRGVLRDVNEGFADLARDLTPEEAEVVLRFLRRGRDILRDFADRAGEGAG